MSDETVGRIDHLSSTQQLSLALEGVKQLSYGHGRTLQEALAEEYGVEMEADICNTLKELSVEYPVGRPGDNVENLGSSDEEPIYRVVAETYPDGEVYMAGTPNQQKARIAFDLGRDDPDDNSDTVFVELTASDTPLATLYDRYADLFGWKKLKDLSLRSLYEYDISAELYNDLTDEMGIEEDAEQGDEDAKEVIERAPPTPPAQQEINVSVSNKQSEQQWWQASDIEEKFQNGEPLSVSTAAWNGDSYRNIERLVLFPSNSERNISDYYWLGGQYGHQSEVALANCNVGTFQYLDGLEGVYNVDSLAEASWRLPVETHDGTTSITQARDDLVFHIVSSEAKSHFEQVADEVVAVLPEFYEQVPFSGSWDGPTSVDMKYAPVTLGDVFEYVPAIKESEVTVIYGDTSPHFVGGDGVKYHNYDLWLYALARLPNWDLSSAEMGVLTTRHMGSNEDLTGRGYEFIETVAHRHDAGKSPVSQT